MSPPGDVPQGGAAYAAGDIAATINPTAHRVSRFRARRHDGRDAAGERRDVRDSIRAATSPARTLRRKCHPSFHAEDPCLGGSLPDRYSWVRQAQHGLEMTAEASGGFAITNTNDFTKGLSRIIDDLDRPTDLLGFYTARSERTRLPAARREGQSARGLVRRCDSAAATSWAGRRRRRRTPIRSWRCPPVCLPRTDSGAAADWPSRAWSRSRRARRP